MKRYWKYVKPYLPAFIIGPLLMIVEVIGEVVLPKLMANIINVGVTNGSVGYITGTGALMILVALLMMAGGVGGAYFGAKAAVSFAADLRKDAFETQDAIESGHPYSDFESKPKLVKFEGNSEILDTTKNNGILDENSDDFFKPL